jgi:two-component system nitrate/nitrite response regulator NarL
MASLAVFDPSPLFRAGLAALVRALGFAPVEEAADLAVLMGDDAQATRPDLVLTALPQSASDIAPLMREIRDWAAEAKVVFIARVLDVPTLIACFVAGASGYLIENISREGLKHSIMLVSAGEKVFPSELANALTDSEFSCPADLRRELRDLRTTEREVEVLRCLTNGRSNHAIAAALGISETRVGADIHHILKKLGVSNRTQAAMWAVAKGLAPPLTRERAVAFAGGDASPSGQGARPRRASSTPSRLERLPSGSVLHGSASRR